MKKLVMTSLLVSLIARAAVAQRREAIASELDITIAGGQRCVTQTVAVVIQGQDHSSQLIPAKLVDADECRWHAKVPQFLTKSTLFSLRLDRARTECHKSDASEIKDHATLYFYCCNPERLRSVSITPDSAPVSYLRDVLKKPPGVSKHDQGRPCIESGTFDVAGEIKYVQFNAETVYLQPDRETPDKNDMMLTVKVNLIADVQKGRTIELTANEIRHWRSLQRVNGDKSGAALASTAIDIDHKNLKSLRSEKITVTGQ